jgi:peptide deformylase
MRDKVQPDTVWKNVTRKQFITIHYVDINKEEVHYTDNSDNSRNPRVHKKKVDHILRLFEFSTAIIK